MGVRSNFRSNAGSDQNASCVAHASKILKIRVQSHGQADEAVSVQRCLLGSRAQAARLTKAEQESNAVQHHTCTSDPRGSEFLSSAVLWRVIYSGPRPLSSQALHGAQNCLKPSTRQLCRRLAGQLHCKLLNHTSRCRPKPGYRHRPRRLPKGFSTSLMTGGC